MIKRLSAPVLKAVVYPVTFYLKLNQHLKPIFTDRRALLQRRAGAFRMRKASRQLFMAQALLLQNLYNPHFLFNSLSILAALVKKDPEQAERFIEHLSRVYRYFSVYQQHDWVALQAELDFLQSFGFLLQARFEHKFGFRVELDQGVINRYRLPPLTLHTLVENAVQHNRMSEQEPFIVTFTCEQQALVMRHPLQPRDGDTLAAKLGLQRLISRFSLLTPRKVLLEEREDTFVVVVPLLDSNAKTS